MNAINYGDKDGDIKYCIPCKKKYPPVETILKVGENILESRWNKKVWQCDDCNKKIQKNSREHSKGIWTAYEREKEEIDLEQFEREWNDPEFKNVKELSDKLIKVLNKFNRRKPSLGFLKDVMCSVMYKDEWYVTVEKVISDLLKTRSDSKTIQNKHKDILFLYIPGAIDAFREYYRVKARNKFDGVIESANKKYNGYEKLVVRPYHKDEKTKRNEKRWYLLSYEEELKQRNEINKTKKDRIDYNMIKEAQIVDRHERLEKETQKQQEEKSESNKDSNKEGEGGE